MRTNFSFIIIICLLAGCEASGLRMMQRSPKAEVNYDAFPQEQLEFMATQGNTHAQLALGKKLCCGTEPEHDNKRGYALICQAAKQGIIEAQYHLGEIHREGVAFSLSPYDLEPFSLPEDRATAYMWFSIAAQNGNSAAESEKDDLHEVMSFAELNRAIAMRKLWKRKECSSFGVADEFKETWK